MSEPVSPLNRASYEGYVRVQAMGLQGMITFRGDLSSASVKQAVKSVTGAEVPAQRQNTIDGESGAAWMSPDELLLFVPYAGIDAKIDALNTELAGEHFLAANVSDARAMFRLDGAGVREIVAKLMPVDMSSDAFGPGDFRRTRMAQIPAAFWMPTGDSVQIVCFRSVAEYAFNLLKDAAEPGGEVGFLA